jgi:hypothetical protein
MAHARCMQKDDVNQQAHEPWRKRVSNDPDSMEYYEEMLSRQQSVKVACDERDESARRATHMLDAEMQETFFRTRQERLRNQSPSLEQKQHHSFVAHNGGLHERRDAVAVCSVDVGTGIQQKFDAR